MKKVVILNGSPHEHGCTAALADVVSKEAADLGAEVKSYYLNGMNINSCQGCRACTDKGQCIQQDDMREIFDEIASADGIIFATPVYMWQMSAQLKTAVDRLLPFLRPGYTTSLEPGKKVLLAATQGRPDTDLFRHYFEHVGNNLLFLGFGSYKILIAGGTRQHEDLTNQTELLEEARHMGRWLANEPFANS
ncbi:multimeric flavodoxin WrbA [Desulfosporosinus acidiphilus SJ4]|uniref:Multimeric flavodoxin WrbA n=1 Tax=Desulfosporosinus acidiphilus (strain DSM 22704 / JCM 16185 / SJ4) TaxID=646529 RepID=I4D572_DESAJ|nr:flavodoxin family protein [Desulfosporosinus acidiphilus]AFM40946.1 multimeric flavodoxin WrbA [Desulfosporosinus acidiphilus SJ4]